MAKWNKMVPVSIFIIAALVFFFFISGYRFTALNAAKANSEVTKDYQLVDQYKMDSSAVFLFKSDSDEMYRTVLSDTSGLLHRSNSSTYIPYRNESLVTVGGMSVSDDDQDPFTFLSVKSNDAHIDYIIAGSGTNRVRKEIKKGERIFFLFPFSKQIDKLNARAFSDKGKKIYYYGYPKNTSAFIDDDLKWHKVNDS
ncbi:hypothetical protein GCM10008983_07760 [Lentibacillus halophilus]|uniref:Uncharacterized protein n=1 Tax=Lentibacillus halophilus TaxID=295065 RepID=A0ABN0Z505_9BACI